MADYTLTKQNGTKEYFSAERIVVQSGGAILVYQYVGAVSKPRLELCGAYGPGYLKIERDDLSGIIDAQ